LLRPFSKLVERIQLFVKVVTSDETSDLPIIRPKSNTEVSTVKIRVFETKKSVNVTVMLICFIILEESFIIDSFLWSLLLSSLVTFIVVHSLRNELRNINQFRTFTTHTVLTLCHLNSKLLYDWWFTTNQLVLVPSPLKLTTRVFFFLGGGN
jgi:hypothetical protein